MTDSHPAGSAGSSNRAVLPLIALAVAGYLIALAFGLPQAATRLMAAGGEHAASHAPGSAEVHGTERHEEGIEPPPLYTVLPFVLLLGAIAVLPLIPATAHWWEHNRNRFLVALVLALVTLGYYLVLHDQPVERHFAGHGVAMPAATGPSWSLAVVIFENAILNEYVPFIVLLFSLYTIAGGIRVQGDMRAHPLTNTTFLGIGGVLASFVGTTGAAMLLIRPLLETNAERRHVAHTVIFFTFVVCNCGGCLTPLGDPPLFLGYLQGVDFLWTFRLWPQWLFVNGLLLVIYYLWDHFFAYPKEEPADLRRDEQFVGRLRVRGFGLNGLLLAALILSVALLDPSKPLPGTPWHPWLYLRETLQLALVGVSLALGSPQVRAANRFTYAAIIEVAALFFGIFICMQPALAILDARGPRLGIDSPLRFFWATGALSSFLDNAPTYLVFLQTARSLPSYPGQHVAGVAEPLLMAISLGAVFMGAMTYIGNGPNFMVKAVAEAAGVRMPSFFGYIVYSCLILLPIFALMTWLFL
jgi:Na+/H+ antiporter NhaD/arsenite permease-like protein